MKYLHDTGFKVLTVNDLGYDTKNNFLYIKPSISEFNQPETASTITTGATIR